MASRGHHAGLRGLPRVLVHQDEHFAGDNLFLQRDHATKLADGVGMRTTNERFTRKVLAVHAQRHRQSDTRRATPLYSTIISHRHLDHSRTRIYGTSGRLEAAWVWCLVWSVLLSLAQGNDRSGS